MILRREVARIGVNPTSERLVAEIKSNFRFNCWCLGAEGLARRRDPVHPDRHWR